jgi:DNA-binding protein H-NS
MPKKKQEPVPLSIDQMEQQLAQIEADREKLEAALQQRRQADLVDFAESIGAQIAERGYRIDEVIALLQKGRKTATRRRAEGQPRYVDPDDPTLTYRRGPLPGWLREKMQAAGYDTTNRAQREAFKSNHLKRVA